MKKFALCLVFFVGCAPTIEQTLKENEFNLKNGVEIGSLADGRVVTRYKIRCEDNNEIHYIYDVGGITTSNHGHMEGKIHRIDTTVIIDGVKYLPEIENDSSCN